MTYFVEQLKNLKSPSVNFKATVLCLSFLYELFPFLDSGDFASCESVITNFKESLLSKINLLSLPRQAELNLYIALVYIGLKNFHKARETLNQSIMLGKNYFNLPLYRTIRLVNLMLLYEMRHSDLIKSETRSIRRDMKDIGKGYRIERIMLNFVNKQNLPAYAQKREEYWEKIYPELLELHSDIFELQVIKIFDFTAWIESKILKIPLSETLQF